MPALISPIARSSSVASFCSTMRSNAAVGVAHDAAVAGRVVVRSPTARMPARRGRGAARGTRRACRRRAAARRRSARAPRPSKSSGSAAIACSTARPVPGISSWSTTTRSGRSRLDLGGHLVALVAHDGDDVRGVERVRRARARAPRSATPASGCSSFGRGRLHAGALAGGEHDDGEILVGHGVPRVSTWLRHQDSNLDLTAPKAVVLPLHHGGPLRTDDSERPTVCQTRRRGASCTVLSCDLSVTYPDRDG